MARKMTAIARSATATEFIGKESVKGQASTDKSQSSEKDKDLIIGQIDDDKKLTLQNSRMKLDVERLLKEALLDDQPKVKKEENSNFKPVKGGYHPSFKR